MNYLMKIAFLCLCLMVLLAPAAVGQNGAGTTRTAIGPVLRFSDHSVIPIAGATMNSNNLGVMAQISTSNLTPGNVATLWWAIFNNAKSCAGAVCAPSDLNNPAVNGSLQFGGGQIVGINGRADFGGYLANGDNSGYYILFPNMPNPAPGLVSASRAQIHLVIRDHGPASVDPMILEQQLSSFGGGCSVNQCANVQVAIF